MRQSAAGTAVPLTPARCFATTSFPPLAGPRRRLPDCSGFRASIFTTSCRKKKPVSPAIAVRLGKLFGDGAGIWTRMQAAYDTWHAERTEDVSHIRTIKVKAA